MRTITKVGERGSGKTTEGLTLSFDKRRRSRLRATLDSGEEVAVFLPRGTVLEDGDVVLTEDGARVRVNAAAETLSRAVSSDVLLLARAAYHLGNRHVPIQVGAGFLAYQHDHVLDDMVRRQGLDVTTVKAPFEPESGAYGGHGHSHHHGHEHHDHDHDHDDHDHHDH